ncbi:hypothetical protein L3Q82_021707 [Scortum barcoo]|uniref:Uncharacterized protein n=1 Tax=Scortum barcoo TaxID=214431 RepID=A0ACB8X514_9TELE|nr:hypothetical protein L3Q82_021707 [Scortum barcoo]
MKSEMNLVFCLLVVLTGSSQARGKVSSRRTGFLSRPVCLLFYLTGQSKPVPPVLPLAPLPSHAGSSASPDLTEDPGNEVPKQTHNPAARDETSTRTTAVTKGEGTVQSEAVTKAEYKAYMFTTSAHTSVPVGMTADPGTPPPSAAADALSSTPAAQSPTPPDHISPTEGRALLTGDPLSTLSSQSAHTAQDTSSAAHASTIQPQSESLATDTSQPTTGRPLTSAPGRGPVGPTHQEVPPELNVGDEGETSRGPATAQASPLDPLLAGLLSVFIVTTAIVFVILFLKFRQRTNHPEFHRLQDLPMSFPPSLQLTPKREITPRRTPTPPTPILSGRAVQCAPLFGFSFGKRDDGKHVVEQLTVITAGSVA